MLTFFAQVLLVVSTALAAPVENAQSAAATVGKIRGVRDPIYHLYLQASSKNGMLSSASSLSTSLLF
jgi:carbonyl reductase 1